MKYDIIIPHYGSSKEVVELAQVCLRSIRRWSKDYRLVWIDNGGSEPLLKEINRHREVLIIRLEENVGFVKAVNLGLQVALAPYVVVMNNDTEAVSGWLEKLSMPLQGAVIGSGPRTITEESWQGKSVPVSEETVILSRSAMLAFFCVMFQREVIQKVGLLDEDYGLGFGDDDDYCDRIHKKGLRLAWVTGLTIPHHHRTTFRTMFKESEIKRMQTHGMALFKNKVARREVEKGKEQVTKRLRILKG